MLETEKGKNLMWIEIISSIEKLSNIAERFIKKDKLSLLRCSFYEYDDKEGECLCGIECNIYNNGVINDIIIECGHLEIDRRFFKLFKKNNAVQIYLDVCKGNSHVKNCINKRIFFNILDNPKNDEYEGDVLKRKMDVIRRYFFDFYSWQKNIQSKINFEYKCRRYYMCTT